MLYELLRKQSIQLAEKPAVVGEASTLNFDDLFVEASALARYLQHFELPVGATVLIGIAPSPEFYVAFHAVAALGLVILPVLPSGKLSKVIVDSAPLVAFGSAGFVRDARAQCPSVKVAIEWHKERGLAYPKSDGELRRARVFAEDKIIGVSSSGSTGEPTVYFRAVDLLLQRARFRAQSLGITANDVLLSARPFNSGSSINSHVLMPLVTGSTIAVQEKFQRFQAAEIIDREKVTVLYAVPFIFELLASRPKDYPVSLKSLRLCISGSAPLAASVAQAFYERFGVEIRQRYGGSHIHPAFTFNEKGVAGAVGQTYGPFPIVILDAEGTRLPAGEVGEIAFDFERIAAQWQYYLKTNPNLHGRYIHTGDLGKTDADGNVFVVGRKSPFIKVGGNRVEPAEVEYVLRSHPRVQEVIVYGIPFGEADETIVAKVIPNAAVTQEELIRYCISRLEGYKCPTRIEFCAELPRSAHGKVLRTLPA